MTKDKSSSAYRMVVQFNTDDDLQRQCLNFLGLCGYKKNQILGIMAKEFIETYNFDIDKTTSDDIKAFLGSYQYIQNFKRRDMINIMPYMPNAPAAGQTAESKNAWPNTKHSETENIPEEPEDVEIDVNKADRALSVFGL